MVSIDVVRRLCNLPRDHRMGEKSAYQLVHDVGIELQTLSVEPIGAFLRENPELITEWLRWSENKRSSDGYYFLEEKGVYIVGYYPEGVRLDFDNPISACASFIVKEVSSIW